MPVYTPTVTETALRCPEFSLPSVVDGKFFSSTQLQNGKPFLIMFICNHCPYVKAIEDRLIQLAYDLQKIAVTVVAICANDEDSYPEDKLENLKNRALEKKFPFIYLHDKQQLVAKAFNAVCTPDYFGYDGAGALAYRGRLDDSWKEANLVTRRELFMAMQNLANKEIISAKQTPSMGCSIKWMDR